MINKEQNDILLVIVYGSKSSQKAWSRLSSKSKGWHGLVVQSCLTQWQEGKFGGLF